MRARFLLSFLAGCVLFVNQAQAQSRYIVRTLGRVSALQNVCSLLNCTVGNSLDGSFGQLFLVLGPNGVNPNDFLNSLLQQSGILDAELDTLAAVADSGYSVPSALTDTTTVNFYGANVQDGYVNQPATQIVRSAQARSSFNTAGVGTIAIIDTGVDPKHPALASVLVPGYDFTRNSPGFADETLDLQLASPPVVTNQPPQWTSSRSAALVDDSTAAVVDGNPQYSDFGHGTMVAGIVHLVAPTAKIMPLKAFQANGTGYNSDIIRALYFAIENGATLINMSFNLAAYSQEVRNAINLANLLGIVCVAAAGNASSDAPLYPAAYPGVMGVASTTNTDQLSSFSNYGSTDAWVGAPGEGVVTTYPFATYAAGWGTSFSAPFVAGTAALMRGLQIFWDQYESAQAIAYAKEAASSELDNGRLDSCEALLAWTQSPDPSKCK